MAADYAQVGFFLIVGALFVVLNVEIIARLIRPRHAAGRDGGKAKRGVSRSTDRTHDQDESQEAHQVS